MGRLYGAYDDGVGFVDDGCVKRCQVDSGGHFGVVAQSVADDTERYTFRFGCGGPAVASHIKRQRDRQSDYSGNSFQVSVDIVAYVAVGASFVGARLPDYGQQIVSMVFWIFVQKSLHFGGPAYDEFLAGFVAPIDNAPVRKVGFLEKCHVDEAHPAQIETHQKHVSGEIKRGLQRQVERLYFPYNRQINGSLYCLVYSCVHMTERIAQSL